MFETNMAVSMIHFAPTPSEESDGGKHFMQCLHWVCQDCADNMVRVNALPSHDDTRCPVCRTMDTTTCTFVITTQSNYDSGHPLFLVLVV